MEEEKKTLDIDRFMLESYDLLCESYSSIDTALMLENTNDDATKEFDTIMRDAIGDMINILKSMYPDLINGSDEYEVIKSMTDRPMFFGLQGIFNFIERIASTDRLDEDASEADKLCHLMQIYRSVDKIKRTSETISKTMSDIEKEVYQYYDLESEGYISSYRLAYIVAKSICTSWTEYKNGVTPYSTICVAGIHIMKMYQTVFSEEK